MAALAALAGLSGLGSGCGGSHLPEPKFGPHTVAVNDWAEIEDPPPPVQSEEIEPSPGKSYVWIDGQWAFQPLSKRWVWDQGKWCVPPPNAEYYAPSEARRFRKKLGRIVRWNEPMQRYEEVDSSDDRWHFMRGRFYAKAPDGSTQPSTSQPVCVDNPGIDPPPSK